LYIVNPDKVPCGTLLESAKYFGFTTALVVTSRITHATPASFSAHVINRDMEADIAVQQIGDYPLGRQVDLMFGGGRCFFLPNHTEGSCRIDERDLVEESRERGFKYFSTRKEFDDLEPGTDKYDHTLYLFLSKFYVIAHFDYTNTDFLF
jgi:alkaline phosphatase